MIIGIIQGATRICGKTQGFLGLPLRDEKAQVAELTFYGLPVLEGTINDKVCGPDTPVMVTAWIPTPDELKRLNAGAPVIVRMIGKNPPPMNILVGEIPE